MTNQLYEAEAREKLLSGAEKLYNAVKTTMGPRGRNVVIGRRGIGPTITHDGVTVAKAVNLKDEAENVGAELIKEAANKLNDVAGDGTTTVTVLTYHILKEANEIIKRGYNPMLLAREVEKASLEVLKYLEKLQKPADNIDILEKIATLSGGDEQLGKIVADIVYKTGKDGFITVQTSPTNDVRAELIEGLHINNGYMSQQMANNKSEAVYTDIAVVVISKVVHSFMELLPILNKIYDAKITQALFIVEDMKSDALTNLILNSTQGKFRSLVVQADKDVLEDISIAVGATVIDNTIGLENANLNHIGHAGKVISTFDKTTILAPGGKPSDRINYLAGLIESEQDDYYKKKLEKRRANLAGKIGIFHVGGNTDTEIEEKLYRVEDALAATTLALKDGYIQGGGIALYKAPIGISSKGGLLLSKALKQPFKQLINNSGMNVNKCEKAIKKLDNAKGYNVRTGEIIDLVDAGIVDAYGVTREALKASVSLGIAGMTAGALIVEEV